MATLANIQKEIARLEKQAEAIRKAEAAAAASTARELIARHHLSAADVGLAAKPGKSVKDVAAAPAALRRKLAGAKPGGLAKYRDPESGKTWTGTGKPPGWIAGAKSRDRFLINAAVATPATDNARVARKASPQPAAGPAQPAAKAAAKTSAKPVVKPQAKPAATDRATRKAAAPQAAEVAAAAAPAKKAVFRKAAVKKLVKETAPAAPPVSAPAEVQPPAEASGS